MYLPILSPALCCVCAATASAGTWINFFDETTERVVCEPTLFADDDQEKDYAWGDLDRDGDIDLAGGGQRHLREDGLGGRVEHRQLFLAAALGELAVDEQRNLGGHGRPRCLLWLTGLGTLPPAAVGCH